MKNEISIFMCYGICLPPAYFPFKKKKKANTKKTTLKENPINFKTNGYPNF